jgi:hypothetical protein
MGANRKMYENWNDSSSYRFLDWPQYDGELSLECWAQKIITLNDISSHDIIGGSSLGGIIAIEIYKILGNPKVVLLGSAVNISEINSLLLKLTALSDYAPIKLIQLLTGKYDGNLLQMFSGSDPKFIKAMCKLIATWQGFSGPSEKLIRIHGSKDLVINCPQEAELILAGGHLLAMSHARECQALLNSSLNLEKLN